MANGLFVAYRNGILGSYATSVDLDANTIRVQFVDTATYPEDLANDAFYSDAPGGLYPSGRANGIQLTSPTIGSVAAGVFDAANTLFSSFSNGSVSVEGILGYKDDGAADATSPLIFWFDTTITGMPFTPSGGDVTISWNASGIFGI